MVHEEFRSFSLEKATEKMRKRHTYTEREREREREKRFIVCSNARGSEIFSRHLVEETAFFK